MKKYGCILTIAGIACGAAQVEAIELKTFRDCKNVVESLKLKQIKASGGLSKDFVEKTGPLANKMMEACADGKLPEANAALKDLEKITGPIEVLAATAPPGKGPKQ